MNSDGPDEKSHIHVYIRLEQDESGYPPFRAEEVDAVEVGDHEFQLKWVPAFAFGLALGDVVGVIHHDSMLWVDSLIEASGHSTVRIIGLGGRSVDAPQAGMEARGCQTFATPIEGMLAFDVPPGVDMNELIGYLQTGRDDGTWDYSVGVFADQTDG